jgi:dTDP-4-dehydrorhamnose reductase
VFGATSMVGSHFVSESGMTVHAAGRADPSTRGIRVAGFTAVNLEVPADVERLVRTRPESVVVNFAARTEVDRVEQERTRPDASIGTGLAWTVNALAPEAMARAARLSQKYFVQISTDFVYDGTAGPYDESIPRSPFSPKISWYGWTKADGERRLEVQDPRAGILRIAYPYRSRFPHKLDFARALVDKHKAGTLPPLYSDQQLTPTWIPDVTRSVNLLIEGRQAGIFHLASKETTTPYEFARRLFQRIHATGVLLKQGSLASALQRTGVTPRPLKGGLRCQRLLGLGLSPTGWREGLDLLTSEEGWT